MQIHGQCIVNTQFICNEAETLVKGSHRYVPGYYACACTYIEVWFILHHLVTLRMTCRPEIYACKGAFFNYVAKILPIIDLPTTGWHLWVAVRENLHTVDISSTAYLSPLYNVVKKWHHNDEISTTIFCSGRLRLWKRGAEAKDRGCRNSWVSGLSRLCCSFLSPPQILLLLHLSFILEKPDAI